MIYEWLAAAPNWREARSAASARDWQLASVGDWSWVYASPDGRHALRITPWDPGFVEFLALCSKSDSPHLPVVMADVTHQKAGHSTVMEWLEPVGSDSGEAFFRELDAAIDGAMCELREAIETHQPSVPMFEGLDANPANVMRRPGDGTLVLTDAFWINGPELFKMIKSDADRAVGLFGRANLRNWAHLPCMDPDETDKILAQLDGP